MESCKYFCCNRRIHLYLYLTFYFLFLDFCIDRVLRNLYKSIFLSLRVIININISHKFDNVKYVINIKLLCTYIIHNCIT